MAVGLSDAANTCVAFFDEKVWSVKARYPKTPFSYLSIHQYSNSIGSLRGDHLQGYITSMILTILEVTQLVRFCVCSLMVMDLSLFRATRGLYKR